MLAKDRSTLLSSLLFLRKALQIEGKVYTEADEDNELIVSLAEEIQEKLKAVQNALLIFDNVEEKCLEITSKIIPLLSGSQTQRCIITTFNKLAFPNYYNIDSSGFTEDEALQFLTINQDIPLEKENAYKKLASLLSFSPFILQGAKTYMQESRIGPKEMMKHVQKHFTSLTQDRDDKNLFGALSTYIGMLKAEEGEEVFEMFQMLQCLDAENIPICIFHFLPQEEEGFQKIKVNALVRAIQKFSFGSIFGEDDKRQISVHRAVSLALSSDEITPANKKLSMIVKLLHSFMWLFDKDNKASGEDYERSMLLLPHAKYLLDLAERIKCGTTTEEQIVMLYVSDLVGYNFNFLGQKRLSGQYSDKARVMCYKLMKYQLPDLRDPNDLEKKAECTAKMFQQSITFLEKEERDCLRKIAKDCLLNKHRVATDLRAIQKELKKEELEDEPKLTEPEYEELMKSSFAISETHLAILFLFEIVISTMYTYGRRLFYLGKYGNDLENTKKNFILHLYIAKFLSRSLNEMYPDYRLLYSMLSERNGTLELFFEDLDKGSTTKETLRNAVFRLEYFLETHIKYYVYGVCKMDSSADTHHQMQCNKQLIRCYASLWQLEKDEEEREQIRKKGNERADILLGLTKKDPNLFINAGVIVRVADFYYSVKDTDTACDLYMRVCPRDIHESDVEIERRYPSKHEIAAAFGCATCHFDQGNKQKGLSVLNRLEQKLEGVPNPGDYSGDFEKIKTLKNIMETVPIQETQPAGKEC